MLWAVMQRRLCYWGVHSWQELPAGSGLHHCRGCGALKVAVGAADPVVLQWSEAPSGTHNVTQNATHNVTQNAVQKE